MTTIWIYTIVSIFIVSLISLAGVITLSINIEKLKKILMFLVSFSAGALLGDAFIHLLPELVEEKGFGLGVSLSVLSGIAVFFFVEKIINWQHCHHPITDEHVHPFAITNLIGDSVHNFIDGTIIAASYLISIPVGIATTIAVILHEIPQEIGDFGVLLHGGFSKGKAILFNFLTALIAVAGGIIALLIHNKIEGFTEFLIAFASGGFIYIASADLIPELHKEVNVKKSIIQFISFLLGISIMLVMLIVNAE
jgi:zinc and cadmium transporter